MQETLFNPPWWIYAITFFVAAVLLWQGNARQKKGPIIAGLVVLLLGVAHVTAAQVVQTPVEQMSQRTRDIVQSVEDRDWTTFASLLDENTSLMIYPNKQAIVSRAPRTAEAMDLKNVKIKKLETESLGNAINVDVTVYAETKANPVPTIWRFGYVKYADGWKLEQISFISSVLGGLTADRVEQELR